MKYLKEFEKIQIHSESTTFYMKDIVDNPKYQDVDMSKLLKNIFMNRLVSFQGPNDNWHQGIVMRVVYKKIDSGSSPIDLRDTYYVMLHVDYQNGFQPKVVTVVLQKIIKIHERVDIDAIAKKTRVELKTTQFDM